MTLDEAARRCSEDNYPFDAVVFLALSLAQEHGLDFREIVVMAAHAWADRLGLMRDPWTVREPLHWRKVSDEVNLGDELGDGLRAFEIHTDEFGVRRARVCARYAYNDVPHVGRAETFDPRLARRSGS